jgi:hypothetical protein
MTHAGPTPGWEIQRTLDREVELLVSAVGLVANGVAPSTIVANIQLGEAAMAIVQSLADERGVILEALWGPDEAGFDIQVRRAPATP